jgi:two-component system, cell cycle sensor histidine kinase and response regulator CckA
MPIGTTHSIGDLSAPGEREPALRAERLQTLGSLACGIAHDLNNVLTPILLGIETLKLAPDRRRTAKILAMVEANARQVAELADQVLAFAKGIGGKRAAVNVTHLIQDAARTARETFGGSIETRTQLHRNLWWVNADPTQIHQILLNLAVNARDAMAGGGMLTMSAGNVAVCGELTDRAGTVTPGDYVEIKVADTGRGIPPALLEAIFEPFFTTKGVGGGTGIGLSTVAGIVRAHGGFVTIRSAVGEGTEFAVYLPALAPEVRRPAPAEVKAALRANERLVDLRVSGPATVADLAAARRSRAE